MSSNIETIYDILTTWITKFDFVETVTVGLTREGGMLMVVFHCEGYMKLEHIITQYEMENMTSEVLESLEHYLFDKLERHYKIQEVGEE